MLYICTWSLLQNTERKYSLKRCTKDCIFTLKGVSSRFLRQEFPQLEKYYWKGGLWSPSYFVASCGGAPLDIVKK